MPTEPDIEPAIPEAGYEVVEHTADWALRVFGSDLAELLVNAAQGMSSLLVDDPELLPLTEERRLALEAFDRETLLVDWLSELAYWAEEEGWIGGQFVVEGASDTQLTAIVRGGPAAELLKHIKAVTYHNLVITRDERGLSATVVFDV